MRYELYYWPTIQGRYGEAEPLFRRALAIWERFLDLDDTDIATGLENFATLLRETGRGSEAAKLEAHARAIRVRASYP